MRGCGAASAVTASRRGFTTKYKSSADAVAHRDAFGSHASQLRHSGSGLRQAGYAQVVGTGLDTCLVGSPLLERDWDETFFKEKREERERFLSSERRLEGSKPLTTVRFCDAVSTTEKFCCPQYAASVKRNARAKVVSVIA